MRARVVLVLMLLFAVLVVTRMAAPEQVRVAAGCGRVPGGGVAAARRLVGHAEGRTVVELSGVAGEEVEPGRWLLAARDGRVVRVFVVDGEPMWRAVEVETWPGAVRCMAPGRKTGERSLSNG